MIHMAGKHYIPATIGYTTKLAESITSVTAACPGTDVSVQKALLEKVSGLLADAQNAKTALAETTAKVNAMEGVCGMATAFHDEVVPLMAKLRAAVDSLELIVDKDSWPVPTYGDLMFEV